MFKYLFLAFATLCLAQRGVEIARNDRNLRGRRTHWTAIAITLVFLGFSLSSIVETFLVPRAFSLLALVAGALLFATGFAIRRWVLRALGALWAIDIDLKPGHHLIRSGPYRFCRHPNYLAMLFEMTGFCLIPAAFYTLAVFFPLYVLVLAARIRAEEAALMGLFGDQYQEYRRNTFALLPLSGLLPRKRSPEAPVKPVKL